MKILYREPVVEVLHGQTVVDPYRWLELRTSQETANWIKEQQKSHDAYFADTPGLHHLRSCVESYLNIAVVDQPVKVGGKCFYRRRAKKQEQASIYVLDPLVNRERVLVDPSIFGKFATVAIHRISDDGNLVAYELRNGGSDTKAIHIVETATGRILADHLEAGYIRGFVFAHDSSGFYYSREFGSSRSEHTIRFHRYGEDSEDSVLFRTPTTSRSRLSIFGDESRLGALYVHEVSNELVADLYLAERSVHPQWTQIFRDQPLPCSPMLRDGRILLYSEEEAPNGVLVELNIDGSRRGIVVPEWIAAIGQLAFAQHEVYVSYPVDRATVVRRYALNNEKCDPGENVVDFPRDGSIQFVPALGSDTSSFFYSYENFTERPRIIEFPSTESLPAVLMQSLSPDRRDRYQIDTVQFLSNDGTQIPMWLVMRSDLDTSAPHPVLMTSYGGFGVPMTPKFSVLVNVMVELGVIFALPSIRGGGDFGKAWHEQARGRYHQTAVDDFLAAAEWLVNEGKTSPKQFAVFGSSNAGLLVAAAMTQRPDLFAAVLCIAPLLDMVRYEQFDQAAKWKREYGSVLDPDEFVALHAYSPYHRIHDEVNYPATFFVCGDRDDRCNPLHVRKTAARLQDRSVQTSRVLVDYSAERGHTPTMPLSIRIEALTRRLAFLCRELKISVPEGVCHDQTRL